MQKIVEISEYSYFRIFIDSDLCHTYSINIETTYFISQLWEITLMQIIQECPNLKFNRNLN